MTDEQMSDARILIVDDMPMNVRLLEIVLKKAGFTEVVGTNDSAAALPLFQKLRPDLVLLDLMMPAPDGFAVMELIQPHVPAGSWLPILILTGDATPATKHKALSGGATDFLTKPYEGTEVVLRSKNLLRTRFLHRRLENQNAVLEEAVRVRTRELVETQQEVLNRLSRAGEFRDDDTGEHTMRVGRSAALLAEALGLSANEVHLIEKASPLHDIGKIGIPDTVLLKPGKLTSEEFAAMKTHTRIGAEILAGSDCELLRTARLIASAHHERWDGTGYANGLAGNDIPLAARIVAVADVFDALTHERPYKKAWSREDAVAEIERQSGRHFDPRIVAVFLQLFRSGRI